MGEFLDSDCFDGGISVEEFLSCFIDDGVDVDEFGLCGSDSSDYVSERFCSAKHSSSINTDVV